MIELTSHDLFYIVLTSTALLLVLVGFFFVFIQLYRHKQLQFKSEKAHREQEFFQELMRVQLEIREDVMQKLSHEIHDNIGQSLVVAKLQMSSIIQEKSLDRAKVVEELITRSIRDLRNLSKTLNGDYILREGINRAIECEVQLINQLQSLQCTFKNSFPPHFLSPNAEIIVFRCIQEMLCNCIKHSGANHVVISTITTGNDLIISVEDNGKGMPAEWEKHKGIGMENIRKRVEMIEGNLEIADSIDGGTKISIILPQSNSRYIEFSENSHSR
jgi:two-component system NarL family sensor kinase